MSELLRCVEVEPEGEVRGAVVWLHGLGASGHDFEPIVPLLGVEGVRFVFPHAPARPVTINGGMVMPSWYDIRSLGEAPDRESEADVRASAEAVAKLLEREVERGVEPDQLVLAGFSQGGAIALHLGLRSEMALRGLLVLSSYLVLPDALSEEMRAVEEAPPVLFCHGVYDDIVPVQRGRRAREAVVAAGVSEVGWEEFPMGHEVIAEEISVIGSWLRERFIS